MVYMNLWRRIFFYYQRWIRRYSQKISERHNDSWIMKSSLWLDNNKTLPTTSVKGKTNRDYELLFESLQNQFGNTKSCAPWLSIDYSFNCNIWSLKFYFLHGYIPDVEMLEIKRSSPAIQTIKNFFEKLAEEFLRKKVYKNVMKRICFQ